MVTSRPTPTPQKRGVSDYTILQLTGSACNFLKVQENKFGTFSGRSQPIPSPAAETLVLSPPITPHLHPHPPTSPLTPHLWHRRWRGCHSWQRAAADSLRRWRCLHFYPGTWRSPSQSSWWASLCRWTAPRRCPAPSGGLSGACSGDAAAPGPLGLWNSTHIHAQHTDTHTHTHTDAHMLVSGQGTLISDKWLQEETDVSDDQSKNTVICHFDHASVLMCYYIYLNIKLMHNPPGRPSSLSLS